MMSRWPWRGARGPPSRGGGLPSGATPASGSIPPPSPSPPPVAPESTAPSSSPPPSAPKPASPSPPPSSVPPPPSPLTTIPPPTNGGPSPTVSSSPSPPPSSVPPPPSPPSTIPPPPPNGGPSPSPTPPVRDPNRKFNSKDRKSCWQAVALFPGRNPERWRLDAVGNPVFYFLHGKPGIFGYEYDHIEPHSKFGPSNAANCQILQYNVNRAKGNKIEVPDDFKGTNPPEKERITRQQMIDASPCRNMNYGEIELDRIEAAAYGNIDRSGRKCSVYKLSMLAYHLGRVKGDCNLPKVPNCGPTPEEDK